FQCFCPYSFFFYLLLFLPPAKHLLKSSQVRSLPEEYIALERLNSRLPFIARSYIHTRGIISLGLLLFQFFDFLNIHMSNLGDQFNCETFSQHLKCHFSNTLRFAFLPQNIC